MAPLGDVPVRHIPVGRHGGARNMALDAVAANTAVTDGVATVRVYGWEPSTLTLGYAQDPATIDWETCEAHGIEVTRRPTGGGAIYHDAFGDISYSIAAPAEVLPESLMECYRVLCQPVVDAFARMGIEVDFATRERPAIHQPACYLRALHPSHDLTTSDDRKISGNAQYRPRDAVVQHGSLTYRLTPERHLECFSDPDLQPETFEERVTAIEEFVDIGRDEAVDALETTLVDWASADPGTFSTAELEAADRLVQEKFGAEPWIRDRTDPIAEA